MNQLRPDQGKDQGEEENFKDTFILSLAIGGIMMIIWLSVFFVYIGNL